ncbi:BolA family protein [Roseobacter sp.]|uniref:BolA family protein n=1 Tax=Roseobacter sp. TaxID=1907202 RepID=UPI00261EB071|nr:BolA family protein [Roseobacter sp.]MDW3184536.1 BolA family protein [Roseobacter sp.]
MSKRQEIEDRLREAFAPHMLEVVDDSESHRGHAGYPEGGESHFNVAIRAGQFKGMTRVARHRAIHAALGPQLISEIHALAIDADV